MVNSAITKRINIFALMILIVGQTILAPISSVGVVFAEDNQGDTEEATGDDKSSKSNNDQGEDGEDKDPGNQNTDGNSTDGDSEGNESSDEVVDKTELDELLDEVKKYEEDDYTADSFENFIEVVTAGEKIAEKVDAKQNEVDQAVSAIEKAIKALQKETTPEDKDDGKKADDDGNDSADEAAEQSEESEEETDESLEIDSALSTEDDDSQGEKTPFNNPTGFNFTIDQILDGDNNPISDTNELDIDSLFFIKYRWTLDDGHGYGDEDIVSFNLPPQLDIFQQLEGTLEDGLDVFGTYVVSTDGTITITFTDVVTNLNNIKGHIELGSRIDEDKIGEIDDGKIVIGPIEGGNSLTVPIKMDKFEANIDKQGTPIPAFSPIEIKWTINVDAGIVNQTDGIVTDRLPAGLTYKDGTATVDGEQITPTESGNDLTFNLGDFNGKKTIELTTNIDSAHFGENSFKNEASFSSDQSGEIKTDASVVITRGQPLEKKAGSYDSETREISWAVNINFDGQNITSPLDLVDSWTADMELVDGSVSLQPVTLDDDGNTSNDGNSSNLTPSTSSGTGFTVEIPAINQPHVLTYKTQLDNRVLHGEGATIKNKVEWNGVDAEGEKSVSPNLGSKTYGNINYTKQTVDWKITYNKDKQPMTNTTITDKLADGLELVGDADDIMVSGLSGAITTYDPNTKEIKVDHTGTTTNKITITYTTTFDYQALTGTNTGFENKAKVVWKDAGGTEQTDDGKTLDKTFTPNPATQGDGTKSGTYDANFKEITWTVIANYQRNDYTNLVIEDKPEGNQQLVEDSIEVYEATVQPGGGVTPEGNPINVKPVIDGDNFTVSIENTNKTYQIVYKTTLDGRSNIAPNYSNKAFVSEDGNNPTEISASVGITNGGSYVTKRGAQNGNVMDWQVVVNGTQATIHNVVLTDTLSENQEFLENSINVYATNPGLTDPIGNPLSAEGLYTVSISEEIPQTLTLNFIGEIDRAFVVEYSTLYFAGHNETVSNDYKITAYGTEDDTQEESDQVNKTIQLFTGGSASGESGYLKVKKTANDDLTKVFKDVTFNLIDPVSGTVLKTGTTDEDGVIDFGRLKYGTYELEEVASTVPEGYVIPSENFEVEVDNTYDVNNPTTIQTEEIVNKKEIKAVNIVKIEQGTDAPLAGAKFEIQDDNNNVVADNLVTDSSGEIAEVPLPEGDYTLHEVEAPLGYELITNPIDFTIEANEAEALKLEVKNTAKNNVCTTMTITAKENDETVGAGKEYTFMSADGSVNKNGTTNADGEIEFNPAEVPTGEYTVSDVGNNYITKITIDYTEAPCKAEFNLDLSICPDFTLTVQDRSGNARADVDNITIKNSEGNLVEDQNGNTTFTTDQDGKVIIEKIIKPGTYTVYENGKRINRFTVTDTCEATVKPRPIVPPTTPPEVCDDFTITVKEDGELVDSGDYTFTSEDGETEVTGTVESGEIVIDRDDLPESSYTVTDEDGNDIGEVEVEYTKNSCGTTLNITTQAPVCDDFTVTVEEDGEPVDSGDYRFTSEDGETEVIKTVATDGTIVFDREDLPAGEYTVKDEDGNEQTVTVDYSKEPCEATINFVSSDGGDTPPPAPTCEDFTLEIQDRRGNTRADVDNITIKDIDGNKVSYENENGDEVDTFITNKEGQIILPFYLESGVYTIYENDRRINTFRATDTCEATVKPRSSGGGGGYTPPPEDPEEPKTCDNFTVIVKENDVLVESGDYTFTSEDGDTEVTGSVYTAGEIVFDREDLPSGEYTVTNETNEDVGTITVTYEEDKCQTELNITPALVCDEFTVTIKEDGEPVTSGIYTFVSDDRETITTVTVDEDGKVVFEYEDLRSGQYTVISEAGKTSSISVDYSETPCETDVNFSEEPEEPTDPEEPEDPATPEDPEDPEQPEKPESDEPDKDDGGSTKDDGDGKDPSDKDDTTVKGDGTKTKDSEEVKIKGLGVTNSGDKVADGDKTLPKTATNTFNIALIGIIFLALGLILVYRRKTS